MIPIRTPWSRRIGFGALVVAAIGLIAAQLRAGWGEAPLTATAFAIYGTLGGLIVFRRNGHLTGWLLTAVGLAVVSADGTGAIGMPEVVVAWVNGWEWGAVFALFITLVATFPSGRAPSGPGLARLGRIALWSLPVLVASGALTNHLVGPVTLKEIDNPVGVLPDWVGIAGLLVIVGIFVASVASLVVRRRRVTGQARAQFTWVLLSATLLVLSIVAAFLWIAASVALGKGEPGDGVWLPTFLMMLLFPVSFGVAIMRYRLFDIDRIVSRTVTYSLLVGLLGVVYLGVVTVLSSLLSSDSSLVVAASTLTIAVLFTPMRHRVQRAVGRRFDRRAYDARRLSEEFAESLQLRSDPHELIAEWAAVVDASMRPSTVRVWLRGI